MLRIKELIDSSKSALSKSQERINSLKTEWEQLLMNLEEINSLIQLEEANWTQLPKMAEERKKEMTAKYNKLMMI
jgi:predicted DNA-binding ribbon-helix-helix protein